MDVLYFHVHLDLGYEDPVKRFVYRLETGHYHFQHVLVCISQYGFDKGFDSIDLLQRYSVIHQVYLKMVIFRGMLRIRREILYSLTVIQIL